MRERKQHQAGSGLVFFCAFQEVVKAQTHRGKPGLPLLREYPVFIDNK